jgi:excisionase family DNA binding protein
MSTAEVADLLGISTWTVRTLTKQGRLPVVRLSRKTRRYDRGAVLAALEDLAV